jgi:hypothetical protein
MHSAMKLPEVSLKLFEEFGRNRTCAKYVKEALEVPNHSFASRAKELPELAAVLTLVAQ